MQILWWKIIVFRPNNRGCFFRYFFYTQKRYFVNRIDEFCDLVLLSCLVKYILMAAIKHYPHPRPSCSYTPSGVETTVCQSVCGIYLAGEKSKILVWYLLTPQPQVLIITNTSKGLSSVWLETQYHLQIFGDHDKRGARVCLGEKPKLGECAGRIHVTHVTSMGTPQPQPCLLVCCTNIPLVYQGGVARCRLHWHYHV